MIDLFVQRAEDCRDTTVEVMSEAVPQGDGKHGPTPRGRRDNKWGKGNGDMGVEERRVGYSLLIRGSL